MPPWIRKAGRRIAGIVCTALLGGLLSAALVRNSPGFEADERLLDARLSQESRDRIVAERSGNDGVALYYLRHLAAMLRGDFGVSPSLRQPIAGLILSRVPVTAGVMAAGVAGGWVLALALAIPVVMCRSPILSKAADILSAGLLALPAAGIAVFLFAVGGPVHAIVGLVLFPRLFEYLRNLLRDAYTRPHVLTAMAKGLHPVRVLLSHVLPVCAPEFLALTGISLTTAFGAAIPIETFCDLPGIGQLAWKAAMARDLPVLVTLSIGIAICTQICNAMSDSASAAFEEARA